MKIYQDKFYLKTESNAFFKRWEKSNIKNNKFELRPQKVEIYNTLKKNIRLNKKSVLEIGPFIGDLLYFLKKKHKCSVYGIEPSSYACKFAIKNFNLKIENKTFLNSTKFLTSTENYQKYDLIICDDVLSWISRDIIFPSLASIDWLLKPNGFVFFRDFYPKYSFAIKNHHYPKKKIFNFKQKLGHKEFFILTGKYIIIQNLVRISSKYQTIKSKNKNTLIWSDCILKKTKNFTHPVEKI